MKQRSGPKSDVIESSHPGAEVLIAYAAGALSGGKRNPVRVHADRCAACGARLVSAEAVVSAARVGDLEPVPKDLHTRAERLFAGRQRRAGNTAIQSARSVRRLRLLASSFFASSSLRPAGVGVRESAAPARHELAGSGLRLEVDWTPSGNAWTIRGRVTSMPAAVSRPKLAVQFAGQKPRPVLVGPRGFFGPVRSPGERLRVEVDAGQLYRSVWISSPRGKSGARGPHKRDR